MAYVGARERRMGDPRLVRGEGQYTGDIDLPNALHAGFVRSPEAHARILSVDLSGALALDGVVAAYSAREFPQLARPTPIIQQPQDVKGHGWPPLAGEIVRYVGEPVAVIVAEDPYVLADAVDAVAVEYEPLPPVVDVEAAADIPAIWDDAPGNVAGEMTSGMGNVDAAFRDADVVVEGRFTFPRSAGAAMEPRAVAAAPNWEGTRLTVWVSTQVPHRIREVLAEYFDLPQEEVRSIAPDVGGAFGVKGRIYQEEYAVAGLALRHGRPVRWVATRTEDLLTTCQGRGQVHHARMAARLDGTIVAIDDHFFQDLGAYTPMGLGVSGNTFRHLLGPYRVPALRARVTGVYTTKVPISPLRGGGRPEGVFVVERLMDLLAAELGMDRAEVRRRNLLPPDAFPYDTHFPSMGGTVVYDSGDYPAYLARALDAIGYAGFPRDQEEARRQGRYLGLGLAAFIEATGTGAEGARVEVRDDGTVYAAVGSPDGGQGHATTFAQIVADRLGVSLDAVTFRSGDTDAFPWGMGTFASRMATYGGNATSGAAREVREHALRVAADMLEIAPEDLEIAEGRITVRGVPGRGLDLAQVAQEAGRRGEPLDHSHRFAPSRQQMWAGGVNAAIVEVDVETGGVTILRYVIVHDCGTVINPALVEGQMHGGILHGLGNALLEEAVYGEDGQPRTTTFADYSVPSIDLTPPLEIEHFHTPSPFNREGIKGAGEGGTISAIPTLISAIENALQPFGARFDSMPLRPEQIVQAVGRTDGGTNG